MPSKIESLNQQFANEFVSFVEGKGGLACARIRNAHCSGELYLHGAHVTAYQPCGHDPVLWMSQSSNFESGKPIRGGVPLCFPWFGPHANDSQLPAHGFARTKEWEIASVAKTARGGTKLEMETEIAPFQLRFGVTFSETLDMELRVALPLKSDQASTFEAALHTYLSIGDIHQIEISGLSDCKYLDKVGEIVVREPSRSPIRFNSETDRVYQHTRATCTLLDPVLKRQIEVSKWGSESTVIWNPWIEKSRRMADFGDEEWPGMVCIETANVRPNQIDLEPGQVHMTGARIAVGKQPASK